MADENEPRRPLKALVVGAGLGGLAAAVTLRSQGHHVEVFEASRLANEAGAAIHVVPNATSILRKIGVNVEEKGAVLVERIRVMNSSGDILDDQDLLKGAHRWQSVRLSNFSALVQHMGAEIMKDYRQTLRTHLHEHMKSVALCPTGPGKPVKLHTSHKVTEVDVEEAKVSFSDHSTVRGDLVVGADGVHSITRLAIHPQAKDFKTSHSAFRFMITRKAALDDPRTADFFSTLGSMDTWYGKDRKVVTYPCSNNEILNFVCIHPAHLSATEDGYSAKPNKSTLLEVFEGFDEKVLALLSHADPATLRNYPLRDLETLPTFSKGRLALVGDAAHPFLPHLAQGGAMAIEDGVSIGVMMSGSVSRGDVPKRMHLYNVARYDRATRVQKMTRLVGGDGLADDDTSSESLSLNEYREYAFSHDEYHASTDLLRRYLWSRKPDLVWREPFSFGPIPGPQRAQQDFGGLSRRDLIAAANSRTATISFKTSATLLRNLFPSAAYSFIAKDTVACASLKVEALDNVPGLGGKGYNLVGLYLHDTQYTEPSGRKVTGAYLPVMFENLGDPTLTGREQLGLPDVYSDVEVRENEDSYVATMSWRGAVWGVIELPALRREHDDAAVSSVTPGNILVHKRIPGAKHQGELRADSDDATCLTYQSGSSARRISQRKKTCGAPASVKFWPLNWQQLPTLHHIVSRLAELPIFDVVSADVVDGVGITAFVGTDRLES